jgi:predicted CopG family antitoxin
MQDLQDLKETYDKNMQKTIVVSLKNYNRLKGLGFGGDSFNRIVERLLDKLESED